MLRILHLTDFHLNTRNLKDWKSYVRDPMLAKLSELQKEIPFDLITFTGDMIDKGGKEYGSPKEGFMLFKNEVIDPLLKTVSLSIDKFLIIPGNHDIQREMDHERIELGNQAYLNTSKRISEFIAEAAKNQSYGGMERIKAYKSFEKSLYSKVSAIKSSILGLSYKFKNGNHTVGIACLNSAWRCYDANDSGKLLIGEDQLNFHYQHIQECHIKIALMHHPLDWLSEVERGLITSHITKDFDILLVGHVHENKTSVHTGLNGTLFINVSPSGLNDIRSDSRTFANGFTVIDFDKTGREINCEYLRYNHHHKEFVPNTDISDDGKVAFAIPEAKSRKKITLLSTLLNNIKEDHFKKMDAHLINVKAEVANTSIKEGFVLPPIDGGRSGSAETLESAVSVSEIVKSKQNLIFFGNQETGKTILLYRLVREFVDEFEYLRKIPVYINFHELAGKEINTAIKEYLRCSSEDVKTLLDEKQIVLLLDNLNYSKEGSYSHQINRIHKFNEQYEGVQIIATGEDLLSGIVPPDHIAQCRIPFKNFFIRNLKTREIKNIMKQWLPEEDDIKQEERLEKLVNSFNSYSLPSTAMSVSLFLWSMENKERKPINNAVLMEIYIEIILEKLTKENIYRDNFDFTNKIQLLAKIAQEMLAANQASYSIKQSEFVSIIENYLKNLVGFQFDPTLIADYFLSRKIFVKYQGDRIKFTYSCFFHFFIAKRMEFDPEFREFVMDENHYYKFHKEIDYYTGLTRSDVKLFEEILKRFEKQFEAVEQTMPEIDIDKYFTFREHETPIAKTVEIKDIKQNRPTEAKMEEYYNRRLEKIPNPSIILEQEGSITFERLIILMANVLRNSEGVENLDLKKRAYNSLIKNSLLWMILYKEYLLDFIKKNQRLPESLASDFTIDYLLQNIPLHVQIGLSNHVGSSKLGSVILSKIKSDFKNKSTAGDIEKFVSVTLYADIHASDFDKYLRTLVKKTGNNIARNYIFYKLIDYYYRRTKPGSSNEVVYLGLLTDLKMRTQKYSNHMRDKLMKTLIDGKKKFQQEFLS